MTNSFLNQLFNSRSVLSRFWIGLLLALIFCVSLRAQDRPNVIVFYTDDWGYADIGLHNALPDVQTPNLDALAKRGILFTDAYVTAPQCAPSRAGLLTGRYQQRFGYDSIPDGPLPLNEVTLPDRLRKEGYMTGMVGKWHLEPNRETVDWAQKNCPDLIINGKFSPKPETMKPFMPGARGFTEFYKGEMKSYNRNFDLNGKLLKPEGENFKDDRFRVEVQTEATMAFIRRHAGESNPFFIYVAYFAPHVPLEATEKYLSRFPGSMPERRRIGLAMMSAVDEGVGKVMDLLDEKGIRDNTMVIFTSDNGAPLGAQNGTPMEDTPVDGEKSPWDGSRNDPLKGEKGMLAEGGIRVPLIISWPKKITTPRVINEPVITLDFAPTILAAAGMAPDKILDGVSLIPLLSGEVTTLPKREIYWRFWNQAAARSGDWKYVMNSGGREMLFNIRADKEEKNNLISKNPEMVEGLKKSLSSWTNELQPPGMPSNKIKAQEIGWYNYYFGK